MALIIQNGFVVDGSGKPGFYGDVVVEGDKIVDIIKPQRTQSSQRNWGSAPRIELACGDGSGEPRAERPNHASTRGWARRAFAAEEFSKRFAAASNLSSLPGSNSAATPSSEHCVIAPA